MAIKGNFLHQYPRSNRQDKICTNRMPKKTLHAGCSKTLRYKAPEIPRSETYIPVRRNDEG
jgi:hypothetical protein